MDPIYTTLTFARKLTNFVSYITGLLSSRDEVVNASNLAQDGPDHAPKLNLKEIIDKLQDEHMRVYDSDPSTDARLGETEDSIWALQDIATSCREQLTMFDTVLQEIWRGNDSSTRWPDFRAALQSQWYANEIEERDATFQCLLEALEEHVCKLARYGVKLYQQNFNDLRIRADRQNTETSDRYHYKPGFSQQLESTPRLFTDTLARLATVEANTRPISVADVDFLRNKAHAMGNANWNLRREQAIINSLGFDELDVQLRSTPDAIEPMFKWVFSSVDFPEAPTIKTELRDWLRGGNGIAQITGGPGSGKSLLMKYISEHRELGSALYQWSNPKPVIVASHFFADLGIPVHNSLKAMLQTLLRALVLQLPAQIEAVYKVCRGTQPETLQQYPWTVAELKEQLKRVMVAQTSTKFCLFIDALDGYDGDIVELTTFLQSLTMTGNVKICVSARPQSAVHEALSTISRQIWIDGQVLRRDLEIFLLDSLQLHHFFANSPRASSDRAEIARMVAEGPRNFLSGRIVVEYLRCRHRHGQTLEELKKLIVELPVQLEPLIRQCVFSSPETLSQSGAQFFLVALAARSPPPLATFHHLDQEAQDPDYARKIPPQARTARQLNEILSNAKARLERRCGGFLRVRSDYRVIFPHAAIRQIFNSGDVVAALRAKVGMQSNLELSLARAYLAYMKSFRLSWSRPAFSYASPKIPCYSQIFHEFLAIARNLDNNAKMHELLDDWEGSYSAKCRSDQAQLGKSDHVEANVNRHFRRPILDALLAGYFSKKLDRRPDYVDGLTNLSSDAVAPVLSLVITSMFQVAAYTTERERHVPMLRCLLRDRPSLNPNRAYQDGKPTLTPWTQLVQHAETPNDFKWCLRSGLLLLFLRNKADPNAMVFVNDPESIEMQPRPYVLSWVRIICSIGKMLAEADFFIDNAEQQGCLQLLDSLIFYGASAKTVPSSDYFRNSELSQDCRWARSVVKLVLDNSEIKTGDDANFRAGIVERFLKILVRSDQGVDWCWPILRHALGTELYSSIQEKVCKTGRGLENGSNAAKRASDDAAAACETSSKRSRSETEDETMTMTIRMEPAAG